MTGGRIPKQFIPAVEKGFRDSLGKGPVAEYPVVGTRIDLDDGSYHDVDSSEKAFYTAAQGCFREYFKQASPKLLGADHEDGNRSPRGLPRYGRG